jgi:hypothetical protein
VRDAGTAKRSSGGSASPSAAGGSSSTPSDPTLVALQHKIHAVSEAETHEAQVRLRRPSSCSPVRACPRRAQRALAGPSAHRELLQRVGHVTSLRHRSLL